MESLRPDDPEVLGDYRLLRRLGAGGMGQVYLGRSAGGRTVAVKVIRPELTDDPHFRERFRREVEAARRVGGTWTAPVLDADPEARQPWLVTAFVPGPSLHDAVREHGPLPADSVRALGAGLAEALIAVHAAGLVHRDLKPSNVLLSLDGPKVIDFGISRAVDATVLTTTGGPIGSPAFMAPEQIGAADIGPASDVFALGAVLVFAAAGASPFQASNVPGTMYAVLSREPDLSKLPDDLRDLVANCLHKSPGRRPTPRSVLAALAPTVRGGAAALISAGWLPPALVTALSRDAVALLDLDAPARSQPSGEPDPTPTGLAHGAPSWPVAGGQPSMPGSATALPLPPPAHTPPGHLPPGHALPGYLPPGHLPPGQTPTPPPGRTPAPTPHPVSAPVSGPTPSPSPSPHTRPHSGAMPGQGMAPGYTPPPGSPGGTSRPGPQWAPPGTPPPQSRPQRRVPVVAIVGGVGALGVVALVLTVVLLALHSSGGDTDNRASGRGATTTTDATGLPASGSATGTGTGTGTAPSRASGSGTMPSAYVGTWQGQISDSSGLSQSVVISLRAGGVGQTVAHSEVSADSLNSLSDSASAIRCTADMSLLDAADGVTLMDVPGTGNNPTVLGVPVCTHGGQIVLRLQPNGTMRYTSDIPGSGNPSGILLRKP